MKIKAMLSLVLMSLSGEAFGQLGCVNTTFRDINPDRNAARAQEILDSKDDFPLRPLLDKTKYKVRYWISADVLNIRSGPGEAYEIVSETYYGNMVGFHGKRRDWVAISPQMRSKNFEQGPRWVNLKYLSSKQIRRQVDLEILERKCSYEAYGNLYGVQGQSVESGKYNPCLAVRHYITIQNIYFKRHPYQKKYKAWRNAQENPKQYTGVC